MAVSISAVDYWKLVTESRLLAPLYVQQLTAEFAKLPQAAEPGAKALAQWLVTQKALSRYQATVLLAGRHGPFYYGEYKVVSRLEKGSFEGSFRAQHTASGHPVQLRFLTGAVISDARAWEAAKRSVQPCLAIGSAQVQRYFELVDLPKYKFLVSEDLHGVTLEEKLAAGRMPTAEACRLARLAAVGLAAMHAAGRVHGDLRPANFFLEESAKQPGGLKVLYEPQVTPAAMDFADTGATGRLAAMADFLAPELWTPGRAPDVLSDLYALGCVLYAMLAGTPPFAGGEMAEKMAGHTAKPIQPLEKLGVPQPLAQVVTYLLAKNPGVRYASAELAAEQLGLYVEPAVLKWKPPGALPTLRAYEQAMLPKGAAPVPDAVGIAHPTADEALPVVRSGGKKVAPVFAVEAAPPSPAPPVFAAAASGPELGLQIHAPTKAARSAEEILRQRKKQRQRNLVVGLAAACVLAVVGAGGGLWWAKYGGAGTLAAGPEAVDGQAEVTTTSAPVNAAGGVGDGTTSAADSKSGKGSAEGGQALAADDGRMLWASPTSGPAVAFRCVPPEAQVFLIVRPADLVASGEGERVLAALGPDFLAVREAWEAASGFKLTEIEQLIVTLHNNEGKFPRAHFVVKTREAVATDALLGKWGNPAAAKEKEQTYYTGAKWAYYVPSGSEDARTFAMGEVRDVKEVAAAAGAPPAVFREIERLRRASDERRHFTLLFYPQFLFNDDGAPLFAGARAKLKQPLAWLLGDHLQGASVSGMFGEAFYFELRMLASLDKEPFQLADELRRRLDQVPTALEDYFVSLDPPAYWKKLAFRFPGMVHELHTQTRIGVENEQAIMNAYLPATAPHNLVLGSELVISSAPGRIAAAAAAPAAAGPKTLAEALQMKTSFSFDSQSLEFAMRDLADEVQGNLKGAPFVFAIKIIGDDLKLEGITRNQSIRDFKQENQPVADILTALVRKANPVTTVKDPSEKDQKLVWLIGPDPDDASKQAVLITTRSAAGTKKLTLPAVFVAK